MKGLLTITAMLGAISVAGSSETRGEATRGLPRGEEHPFVIEAVFDSPVGEVQFTRLGLETAKAHSGFLRNAKGLLIGFSGVAGPAFCEQWLRSDKQEPLPGGCEFTFYDDTDGRALSVRSSEMTEASIFQLTKGKMRDLGRGL